MALKEKAAFLPGARSTGSYGIPSTWAASRTRESLTQAPMTPLFPKRFGKMRRRSSLLKAENEAEAAHPRTCSPGFSLMISEIQCNTPTPPKMEVGATATT